MDSRLVIMFILGMGLPTGFSNLTELAKNDREELACPADMVIVLDSVYFKEDACPSLLALRDSTKLCFEKQTCTIQPSNLNPPCLDESAVLMVHWRCVNASQIVKCMTKGMTINAAESPLYIVSASYPNTYPGNKRCDVTVTWANGLSSAVTLSDVSLTGPTHQCSDLIRVKAGNKETSAICGDIVTEEVTDTVTEFGAFKNVQVSFKSDRKTNGDGKGFLIRIDEVDLASDVVNCDHDQSCMNHGKCLALGNFRRCMCFDPWHGPQCQEHMRDRCMPNPCLNGGTCQRVAVNGANEDFFCSCAFGFRGGICDITSEDEPHSVGGEGTRTLPTTTLVYFWCTLVFLLSS